LKIIIPLMQNMFEPLTQKRVDEVRGARRSVAALYIVCHSAVLTSVPGVPCTAALPVPHTILLGMPAACRQEVLCIVSADSQLVFTISATGGRCP